MPSTGATSAKRPRRDYGGVSAEQRIARRREQLLDAALERFGTQGFLATGVKDLARAAGLSDRYFYESFADSTALFIAVFDRAVERLLGLVAEAVAAAPGRPPAQARAAIEVYVRALDADPRIARVIFAEAPAVGIEAERHMRATLRRFAALVAATARPHLPEPVDDGALALRSLGVVGAIERVMIERQEGELTLPLERVVDELVELLLSWLD